MATITPVNPKHIYEPRAHYDHAIEVKGADRLLFISGTLGFEPAGGIPAGLEAQLELIWSNIDEILKAAGMTKDNIVKTTTFLTHPAQRAANGAARVKYLGPNRPASSTFVVGLLDAGWLVEIEAIAAA